ncbi:MAG: 50S ribosomal protein L13 [Euryarchaeota archaeon]|nr:50S ribosomal protein L13 [Euryarchaeota archaeon]
MSVIIDAEGHVLGRLSTYIAKRLLDGDKVIVVNAEKAVITGSRSEVFTRYHAKHKRGVQNRGPFFPKRADLILKRTVRGMIPFRTSRGREIYRNLLVYVGVPKELASTEMMKVDTATKLWTDKYVTLGEISEHLGSRVR